MAVNKQKDSFKGHIIWDSIILLRGKILNYGRKIWPFALQEGKPL